METPIVFSTDCECEELNDPGCSIITPCNEYLRLFRDQQVASRLVTVSAGQAREGIRSNPYRIGAMFSLTDSVDNAVALRIHDTQTDPTNSAIGGLIGFLFGVGIGRGESTLRLCAECYRRIIQGNVCVIHFFGPTANVSVTEILARPDSPIEPK